MNNNGHVWVPLSVEEELMGRLAEYNAAKRTYRMSWRTRQCPSGRRMTIENLPFRTDKGATTMDPLQVACMAFPMAVKNDFDVIHVHTPPLGTGGGDRGIENLYFRTAELRAMDQSDPDFFPHVEKGLVKFEEEAVNTMPGRFEITDAGLFVPSAR
jgi:hypothetical protein